MAISYLSCGRIQGIKSDTKPTNVPIQSLFEETDTGKFYKYMYANGFASASWIEMGTGGVITQNTTLNSSLVTGGYDGSAVIDSTETFSGGVWSASHDLGGNRGLHAGGGHSTSAMVVGGDDHNWTALSSTEKLVSGAWGSADAIPAARYYTCGGGSPTDFLLCQGNAGNSAPSYNRTKSWTYDGSTWANASTVGWECYGCNMGGNATSAVCFGGNTGNSTDDYAVWNGSSWGTVGSMNEPRYIHGGDGTSTNAIAYQGAQGTSTARCSETFNGSSWTDIGYSSLSSYARYGAMACGTGSVAVCGMGKANGVYLNSTETWDGSAWATSGNPQVTREYSAGGYAV